VAPFILKIKFATSFDVKLIGLEIEFNLEASAYSTLSPLFFYPVDRFMFLRLYYCPNIRTKSMVIKKILYGAMRGFSVNQANFAMKSSIDELCIR